MTTSKSLMALAPSAYLSLEGEEQGVPEGPEYLAAVEAMTKVAKTLREALLNNAQPGHAVGRLEKLFTMKREAHPPTWHWRLLIRVPRSVTTTAVEFAKHVAGIEAPIALKRVSRQKNVPSRAPASREGSSAA